MIICFIILAIIIFFWIKFHKKKILQLYISKKKLLELIKRDDKQLF